MSEGGIDSKFLMSIDISFEPPVVTRESGGHPVTGGSFEGPQLKGDMIGPVGIGRVCRTTAIGRSMRVLR